MSHPPQIEAPRRARSAQFRPDIQGMRALAVLAIIVYHAGFEFYPGGFVTLDVFFVISGFLITHLLALEVQRTGTLSLRDFYRRRARRILPAATVAAIGTVIASWLWLSLISAEDAAKDAIWAAFFGANIRFAQENTDYFAQTEAPSPFQHFWSLSVEEQFYAGLPLVLLGCAVAAGWLGRRRIRALGSPARVSIVVLGLVSAASFAWSIHASTASPESAYFSTFTRIWEFGVGALLALTAPRLARSLPPLARNLLALSGLAAIGYACLTVESTDPYPGSLALLPVLGTAAIMLAGAEDASDRQPIVQRALGVGPLRLIGDASYSLYLWHWPVLTIATQYLGREMSPRGLAFALIAIFGISFLSYYVVETPFRRGLGIPAIRGLALYPVTIGAVVICSILAMQVVQDETPGEGPALTIHDYQEAPDGEDLTEDPAIALVQASAKAAMEDAPIPAELSPDLLSLPKDKADRGDCIYEEPPWSLCPRGDVDAERTIVVLGDSHGRHWIPTFEEIAEHNSFTTYYLVKSRCSAARGPLVTGGETEPSEECADFNQWAAEQIAEIQPDLVVVSTTAARRVQEGGEVRTDLDLLLRATRDGFGELIDDVAPATDRVVILGDVPRRKIRLSECLSQRTATLRGCVAHPIAREEQLVGASKEAAEERGADFIGTRRWFCADDVCPPVIGSTIPLRDRGHMTTVYAEQLAEPVGKALGIWQEQDRQGNEADAHR